MCLAPGDDLATAVQDKRVGRRRGTRRPEAQRFSEGAGDLVGFRALTMKASRLSLRAPAMPSCCSALAVKLSGFITRAMRRARGAISVSSSMRLPLRIDEKRLTPVRLPPGRLRLATRPWPTGSAPTVKTIGMALVARLRRPRRRDVARCRDRGDLHRRELGRKRRQLRVVALGPAVLDAHVAAFDEARLGKALPERDGVEGVGVRRHRVHEADDRHVALRARRTAHEGRSAEERQQAAPFHRSEPSIQAEPEPDCRAASTCHGTPWRRGVAL